MEHRSRRRPAAAGRSRRNKKDVLSAPERRRLAQLGASIALFLLVFAGRGVFPDLTARWQAALARDTDFTGAFSRMGTALSQGEPLTDALGRLWTEIFAGGAAGGPEWDDPDFVRRVTQQLSRPGPVLLTQLRGLPEGKDRAVGNQPRSVQPVADQAPESFPEGEPDPEGEPEQTPEPGLDPEPAAAGEGGVSAVTLSAGERVTAQTRDGQGRTLPAGVTTVFCELGLTETADPVQGVLTSDYGYRDHPVTGDFRFHKGVDLGAASGTAITAFAGGTVAYTGRDDTCGLYFRLDHSNGVSTFYCHCSELKVLDGQTVKAGQVVAKVGQTGNATGPHLHFAVLKDGVYLDPMYYINAGVG